MVRIEFRRSDDHSVARRHCILTAGSQTRHPPFAANARRRHGLNVKPRPIGSGLSGLFTVTCLSAVWTKWTGSETESCESFGKDPLFLDA